MRAALEHQGAARGISKVSEERPVAAERKCPRLHFHQSCTLERQVDLCNACALQSPHRALVVEESSSSLVHKDRRVATKVERPAWQIVEASSLTRQKVVAVVVGDARIIDLGPDPRL